jgi:hypothetical protein
MPLGIEPGKEVNFLPKQPRVNEHAQARKLNKPGVVHI